MTSESFVLLLKTGTKKCDRERPISKSITSKEFLLVPSPLCYDSNSSLLGMSLGVVAHLFWPFYEIETFNLSFPVSWFELISLSWCGVFLFHRLQTGLIVFAIQYGIS